MKTAHQLLHSVELRGKPFMGPHTAELSSAIIALQDAMWFKACGTNSPLDNQVTRVASWHDALAMLEDAGRRTYNVYGTLVAPMEMLLELEHVSVERTAWWQKARSIVRETVLVAEVLPRDIPQERREYVFEYVWEYQSLLLAEIIHSDAITLHYFRDLLPWFHAGYFPCGWQGHWPAGRLRVY